MPVLSLAQQGARFHGVPSAVPPATAVGDLIALPILRTTQGRNIDLAEQAAGRPVVLGVVGDEAAAQAMLAALAVNRRSLEDVGATAIVVVAENRGRTVRLSPRSANAAAVAIDPGARFTRSLGLAARAGLDESAVPCPVIYGLAPCGRVIFARLHDEVTFDPGLLPGVIAAIAHFRHAAQPLGWEAGHKTDAQLFMESFA